MWIFWISLHGYSLNQLLLIQVLVNNKTASASEIVSSSNTFLYAVTLQFLYM